MPWLLLCALVRALLFASGSAAVFLAAFAGVALLPAGQVPGRPPHAPGPPRLPLLHSPQPVPPVMPWVYAARALLCVPASRARERPPGEVPRVGKTAPCRARSWPPLSATPGCGTPGGGAFACAPSRRPCPTWTPAGAFCAANSRAGPPGGRRGTPATLPCGSQTGARLWMRSACAKPRCRQPGTAAAAHRLSQPCAPRQGPYRSREPGQLLDKPAAMSLAGRRLACRTPSHPQHSVPEHPSPSTSAAQARGLPHGLPAVRAAGGPARVGPASDARRGRHGPAAPARHQADAGRARLLPGWRAPSPTRRCRARNDYSLLFPPCNFSFYSMR